MSPLAKIEAPKEYRELGEILSAKRREEAEGGTYHVTARKLDALFEQALPPFLNITSSYGLRASEIARTAQNNKSSNFKHGLFPGHVGIDGTNIWAAATSGDKAITVHLLACMLARLWPALEAISIWVELVAESKTRLKESGDSLSLLTLAAMDVSISRDHLAEWDASARAWLSTADKTLEKQ